MRKLVSWFQTRSEINRSVQCQKKARSLKFGILEGEYCITRVAKTKTLISCADTVEIVVF